MSVTSYTIEIEDDDALPYVARVTSGSGRVVEVTSSSSAYEAARAGLATMWLMEGGYHSAAIVNAETTP